MLLGVAWLTLQSVRRPAWNLEPNPHEKEARKVYKHQPNRADLEIEKRTAGGRSCSDNEGAEGAERGVLSSAFIITNHDEGGWYSVSKENYVATRCQVRCFQRIGNQ